MQRYFDSIKDCVVLDKEAERVLLEKAKEGDNKAYEKVISSNLKFVISVAKQYQKQGLPLDELIAEGNLGLVKAYHKFSLKFTNGFITYAVWWIRQAIMNAIHEHSKLIRLPANKIANITKVNKAIEALKQELYRDPTNEEICEFLALNTKEADALKDLKYSYSYVPLDAPQTDNSKTLHEVLVGDPLDEPENQTDSLKQELEILMKDFTNREKHILYMYFGIDNPRNYTLEEIGVDLGLTRERIRQIKLKVLNKLRLKHRSEKLRIYLEDDLYKE
ncbi:sigma-70 family RNA polymerase sigma factor [bacterium]|nr:sigma-70 family RNA polymerase sigma factor [bacterium]